MLRLPPDCGDDTPVLEMESTMTWVLIVLVLVIAFGPVLWLVPSKRDKRLSAMRSRARSEGLIVEVRRIPKPDPDPEDRVSAGGKVRNPVIECASYALALPRSLKVLPAWRVLRKASDGRPDPFDDWQYDQRPKGEGRAHLDAVLALAAMTLDELPEDVVALEVSPRMVLAYWLERPGSNEQSVPPLAATLKDFAAALGRLEAEIEAARVGDDS
jgi:hypothetical protein